MSKHWQPPKGKIVRIRPVGGKRLRSLDEFTNPGFGRGGKWTRIRSYWHLHRTLPEGAKAGLLVIAAACLLLAVLAYQLLGPRDIVADEVAVAQAVDSAR
jgi:hypothetical protein